MQGPLDQAKAVMAQRMASQAPGMAGGGLQQPTGYASSPMGQGQYPPTASPQMQSTPGFEDALNFVEQTLVQGNEGDLAAFGAFMGRLQTMIQQHQQGGQAAAPGQMPPQMAPAGV